MMEWAANALVPELSVGDWRASLDFYVRLLGFSVLYDRPEEGFAFLALGRAQLMIDQIGVGRDFDVPDAPRERPFGRGMNLQIEVDPLDPILDRLAAAGVSLFLGPEIRWYRRGACEAGQRQAVVADPDGYLLRLVESLGERPAASGPGRAARSLDRPERDELRRRSGPATIPAEQHGAGRGRPPARPPTAPDAEPDQEVHECFAGPLGPPTAASWTRARRSGRPG